jgi:formylglycine-generating enzyme required for sulfatase activity
MKEVIASGRLNGRHDLTSLCLREAAQPSEEPFKLALRSPAQRYDALQALTILRELNPEPMRRLAEEVAEQPEKLFGVAPSDLSDRERELAARLLEPVTSVTVSPLPEQPVRPLVFISYSARDRDTVNRIRAALEKAGVRVWHDTSHIKPGDIITRRIEEGAAECSYFLPVISLHFQASRLTQFEENLAWQREVKEGRAVVLPVLLQGDVRGLPLRYRRKRLIDLRQNLDAGLAQLVQSVQGAPDLPSVRVNPIDGTELVLIPAGKFKKGSKEMSDNRPGEMELPAFYLARYPVTNAQYKKYLDANPQARKPEYWDNERFNQPEQPVVGVNAEEAEAYCRWAGLRLPTEWEWEKGARGTDGKPYPWGREKPTKELANFNGNVGHPTPVGSYPKGASPYGLMDMAGNVWEWTASIYKEGEPWRTLRGGSFVYGADYLRAAFRFDFRPDDRYHDFGFRCAQDP